MVGAELLDQIAEATGLPDNLINRELAVLIKASGKDSKDISLDDIRSILTKYLQDVLIKAKEELNSSGL